MPWKSRWEEGSYALEIQVGGGILHLGNPDGRGDQRSLEIQVGGGIKKCCHPWWGCGFFLE